jgi:subtilisin family serine protease
MKRVGSGQRLVAVVIAAVMLVPSFGTSWTARQPSLHSTVIDPSLSAGEVALVHTTAGHAGALSLLITNLGATDVQTEAAADTVIARLSPAALAAVKSDPNVTLATTDTRVVMSGDGDLDTIGNPSPADSVGLLAINGPRAWKDSKGKGVTVALMDSGIADHPDLKGKVRARVDFVKDGNTLLDPAGHGTHIAGLIAADGEMKGVAPDARLVSLRVLDANGDGKLSDIVKAFDWLLRHRKSYNIEVLNVSWGAPQATSYHKDLLSALVESTWFAGITVVVAAGNDGPGGAVTTPASDPFVITVGSFDDQGTVDGSDDVESAFSSRGTTLDGFAKPDLLAPGRHVVSLRANGAANETGRTQNLRQSRGDPTGPAEYIRMSGTSASAGFVSGVAALIMSDHHHYRPTQVKGALVASGRTVIGGSARGVDAASAIDARGTANVGLRPSSLLLHVLLASGVKLRGVTWEGVTWEGITWESVTWEYIRWESVSWETVSWETVSWETVTWEGVVWEKVMAK